MARNAVIGRTLGHVICRVICHDVAPSTAAASYSDLGTRLSAAT